MFTKKDFITYLDQMLELERSVKALYARAEEQLDDEEMYSVFNMGLGMVMVVAPYYADSVLNRLRRAGEAAQIVGRIVRGKGTVTIE